MYVGVCVLFLVLWPVCIPEDFLSLLAGSIRLFESVATQNLEIPSHSPVFYLI